METEKLKSYHNKHTFLTSLPNVQVNFKAVDESQKHPLEQVYIYHLFKKLEQWEGFKHYNFFIIGANSDWNFDINGKSVVIFLSNEDHSIPESLKKAKAIFTPYCPFNYKNENNIFPIPLGYNGSLLDLSITKISERKVDFFYSGNIYKKRVPFFLGMKWHFFREWLRLCKKSNHDVKFNRGFGTGFSPEDYSRKLMNSKLAIVPEGYLSDVSFRFFEASKYGSVIITKKLYDYWFFKPFPGIEIDSWASLSYHINNLLTHPEKMYKIQKETLKYYEDYCSEQAVANYIIKQLS